MAAPTTSHLLKRLRALMQSSSAGGVHAYIVPSGDSHQSEYIADCDARRQFISRFTGSAGTVIVTLDKAALWTDGRYHLQASKQLDLDNWILMKDGLPDTPTQSEWLKDVLSSGSKVGVDPFLISLDSWKRLSKELKTSNINLVAIRDNLVDQVWQDESVLAKPHDSVRPPRPCNKLIKLDKEISGKEWTVKIEELRAELVKKKTSAIVITALDEIAWLLNLRGSDIDFNPVFFAYCVVTLNEVVLFVDQAKLTPEVKAFIQVDQATSGEQGSNCKGNVKVLAYEDVSAYIESTLVPKSEQPIWVCGKTSHGIISLIPKNKRLVSSSPVEKQKALKNPVEVQNMKNCHVRDGAALCEYLAWLEQQIEAHPDGHESLWEISGADYLEACRKQMENFVGLSFPSISASGPNGSVIHYHPSEATRRPIGKKELYLIDSGAQYLDGTTDVTRTVHFGEPSDKERECFTRVLKGHIQLAQAVFPRLVRGNSLDSFARQYLWLEGLDYLHGTGHGVGMFLNVHEGPTAISMRTQPDDPGLDVGQILSNEPGYYEDGSFGIRIENLVVVEPAETRFNMNNRGFLRLETITLVPIQLKMIDVNLLTDGELAWLNQYHSTVRSVVGAYLDKLGKAQVKQWLIKETEKLERP